MNLKKFTRRLPRLNLIIGKKQIIVAGLTLVLGVAIYVNYLYASSNNLTDTDLTEGAGLTEVDTESDSGTVNYGDAAFVSGGSAVETTSVLSPEAEAYFAQARLDKQESRDEAKEFLAAMYGGGDATGDALAVMAQDAAALTNYIESETKIETLLKAQGFSEVLCYLSDRGANIIVRTDGLVAEDAAKIKAALLSEVSVAAENITIVEIN